MSQIDIFTIFDRLIVDKLPNPNPFSSPDSFIEFCRILFPLPSGDQVDDLWFLAAV
jgi:hypothetical protein